MTEARFVYDRPDLVHRAVCEVLCSVFPTLSMAQLLSSERINHTTAWMRQAGMYVMSRRLGMTQTQTASWFGRDRTTVTHAVQLAEIEAEARPQTAAFFDFLENQARQTLDGYADLETQTGHLPTSLREGTVYHG